MTTSPTLSGAEKGRVRPRRVIEGGIYLLDSATDDLINKVAAVKLIPERTTQLCWDYARQALTERGDGRGTTGDLSRVANILIMHHALCEPESGLLFPLPDNISNGKGKVNAAAVWTLPLWDLADGQLDRLIREMEILKETQTPAALTHAQWESIVTEGKSQSLRTLHLQHGSSALIQVLHGMAVAVWPS